MPSKKTVFTIGFGFLAISIAWALYNAYVPIFLAESFQLSAQQIGWITSFNNALTLLLLPLFGGLSDRIPYPRPRRKPFLLVGIPLSAFFLALIPWATQWGLPLFIAVLSTFTILMATYRSPTIALMPDQVESQYRSPANAIINLMGGIGALLAYGLGKVLYDRSPTLAFSTFAGFLVLAGAVVLIKVDESKSLPPESSTDQSAKVSLLQKFKSMLTGDTSRTLLLVSQFCLSLGFSAIGVFFTSYAKFSLQLPESTGSLLLGVFAIAFILGAIPAGKLGGGKLGRKQTSMIGLGILVTSMLAMTQFHTLVPVATLLFFAGISWALINVNALPMMIDACGSQDTGTATGFYYLAGQSAQLISPVLAGLTIDQFGHGALLVFCSSWFALAALALFRVSKGEAHA
jgi:maltose/moltooligosaccharide transporter